MKNYDREDERQRQDSVFQSVPIVVALLSKPDLPTMPKPSGEKHRILANPDLRGPDGQFVYGAMAESLVAALGTKADASKMRTWRRVACDYANTQETSEDQKNPQK
eukprot:368468_1